jgi:hypothetical protein
MAGGANRVARVNNMKKSGARDLVADLTDDVLVDILSRVPVNRSLSANQSAGAGATSSPPTPNTARSWLRPLPASSTRATTETASPNRLAISLTYQEQATL